MDVTQALEYIHSVCWKGSIPGLGRTQELLRRIGNPEQSLKYIHIAGTNGKGSTAAMLASILQKAGYTTGLFTSPYILRFHERMQVNSREITDQELAQITEFLKPHAEAMEDHPTEFELVSCIGFEYFKRRHCDIVVLEVGMGGELDSTNVIPVPEAAVITNIGLDHMEVLGDTVEKIASAKAGIIKPGGQVVIYRGKASVEEVFARKCQQVGAHLTKADFADLRPISHGLDGQRFSLGRWDNLYLPLLGQHQLCNAAVVLATVDVLKKEGWQIPDEAVISGLARVFWPGRFELLRRDPLFIVDGGHNPQCIAALEKNIADYLDGRPLTLLTGVLADKDYHSMYAGIVPHAKEVFTVTPPNPRALSAQDLRQYLLSFGKPVTCCQSVAEGVQQAIQSAGPQGVVLAYGSLYMVGEIRTAAMEAPSQAATTGTC